MTYSIKTRYVSMNNLCCKSMYLLSLFIPKIRCGTIKIKMILQKYCFLTLKNDEVSQTTPIKDSIGPILAQCRFADFGRQENQYWPNTGYNVTAGSEEAG